MAIDSREKRASATGMHWNPLYPLGDSVVGISDGAQSIGIYIGLIDVPAPTFLAAWAAFSNTLITEIG